MYFYADIILPLAVPGTFTYLIPEELLKACQVGFRVVVPVGKKKRYTGLVVKIHQEAPTDFEVKPVLSVLEERASVNEGQIRLWRWMSNYYLCTLGEIYKAALPAGLRLESETRLLPVESLNENLHLDEQEQLVLTMLKQSEQISLDQVAASLGLKNPIQLVKRLLEKKAVVVQEQVKDKYKPKKEKELLLHSFYRSEKSLQGLLQNLGKAPKQKEALELFLEKIDFNYSTPILKKSLVSDLVNSSTITAMVKKGYFIERERTVSRLLKEAINTVPKHPLNAHQEEGLGQIKKHFELLDTVLLHGVTSSGKTEVYIHLMDEVIQNGGQVLFLLPEIALTTQIIMRLKRVFGNKIGVYHSRFSDAERVEIWQNLAANDEHTYQIVLGVRSGIFLPFNNLQLIIVDEEHENTYKQYDPSPRYNARDLSVVLSKLHGAKVLMGTATPSLETYFNAQAGRYGLVELTKRHQNIALPQIEVADVQKAYKKKQMLGHFTPLLIQEIERALANNEQVILFQNRRGYSPFLECKQCGWVPKCKFCDVSLTYHKHSNQLTCHYCGYSIRSVSGCVVCRHSQLETKGFGTEKVEDEMQVLFPHAKIGRLDLDTTRGKGGHQRIISAFQNHQIDILIGTQMVSKGLDFEHVSVVGVLNADNMLSYPDYRAYERSYQLMAQVSGRAGRKHKQGKVIIQTRDVDNKIIGFVQENNFMAMYKTQMAERRRFLYPPFSRIIEITFKHVDQAMVERGAVYMANRLKSVQGVLVLGPTTPLINRIQNRYIKKIMLKLSKKLEHGQIKSSLQKEFDHFKQHNEYKRVIFSVDVDPQ